MHALVCAFCRPELEKLGAVPVPGDLEISAGWPCETCPPGVRSQAMHRLDAGEAIFESFRTTNYVRHKTLTPEEPAADYGLVAQIMVSLMLPFGRHPADMSSEDLVIEASHARRILDAARRAPQ
jgi:hypothetical protein